MIRPRPDRPTGLQQAQTALADLIADSREQLDAAGYRAFVEYAINIVAREARRFYRWDNLPPRGGL